ncbi:hypothetical protein [Enterobacter cancerogenus]|uniref:hypothetical protein n=1 Tax=Enterobacter cancerogenus TaxID=69218 RepID=UPI00092E86AB|nr:hypothetical protein [Enterobacter cancerogenus]MDT7010050.1 hypothetical protein [Enterobacter cancerogenus]MRG33849.1 hypothetical protein [Enterobacter cancerogenus]QZY37028.1 hypothetical protein HU826_00515 [Enterobacter cancerogenus]WNN56971.1 hypothetical protein RIN64_00495 [Enterobacter cancerogenus]HDR2628084.1 hypothetical protein [Enterobacter cancerogenus]
MTKLRCFEIGISALLDGALWTKWASIGANVATCAAAIIAIIAACIAYCQIISSKKEARKSTAFNSYNQYLLLCINNPDFADGMTCPPQRTKEYSQYRWFVSTMLFTFEQIIDVQPNDAEWEKTIISQLKIHKKLLVKSRTVRDKEWSNELHLLINKAIV